MPGLRLLLPVVPCADLVLCDRAGGTVVRRPHAGHTYSQRLAGYHHRRARRCVPAIHSTTGSTAASQCETRHAAGVFCSKSLQPSSRHTRCSGCSLMPPCQTLKKPSGSVP